MSLFWWAGFSLHYRWRVIIESALHFCMAVACPTFYEVLSGFNIQLWDHLDSLGIFRSLIPNIFNHYLWSQFYHTAVYHFIYPIFSNDRKYLLL